MPSTLDMPLVISQMTHVQKVFNAELVKSELQHALVINPNESDINKEAKSQVQKIEEKSESSSISNKKEGSGNNQASMRNKKKKNKEEEKTEDNDSPKQSSPWSGNIINVKI